MLYPMMTGVVAFENQKELVGFLEEEIRIYKELIDQLGDKLGKLLRTTEGRNMKPSNAAKSTSAAAGWARFGELLVNRSESPRAEAEIYFEATAYLKTRLARLEGMKEGLSKLAELEVNSSYIIYLKEGIPERVLLRRKEQLPKFLFQNEFLVQ